MLNLILNIFGAACVVMLFWYLLRASLQIFFRDGQADAVTMDDYLLKITRVTGMSAYDTFRMSAEEWRIPNDRMEQDFTFYLTTQKVPYYVKDIIRKSRKQIDELYVGSGGFAINKKLAVFFSILVLVFWGGTVLLSVFVLPSILPEDLAYRQMLGPP